MLVNGSTLTTKSQWFGKWHIVLFSTYNYTEYDTFFHLNLN